MSELGARLRGLARSPGVAVAVGSALVGALALWVFALLTSFLPVHSLLGNSDHLGHVTFAFAREAELTLTGVHSARYGFTLRQLPATLVVVTVLVVAVPAALLAPRTRGMPAHARLLWGLGAGLPFGLIMLLVAAITGTVTPADRPTAAASNDVGGAFVLGVVWGALGGAAGVAWAVRREGGRLALPPFVRLPAWTPRARALLGAALRPLAAALVVAAVVGTAVWVVQTARDAGHVRTLGSLHRSVAGATIDDVAFAADNGLHLFELGSVVGFHQPGIYRSSGMPIPATRVREITGPFSASALRSFGPEPYGRVLNPPGRFDLFDYTRAVPALGVVGLAVLLVACLLLAGYGGYALARVAGARTRSEGAAWGALLGPIWAVAMLVLNAIVQKQIAGKALGDDILVVYGLGGAAVGALGGLLRAVLLDVGAVPAGEAPAPGAGTPLPTPSGADALRPPGERPTRGEYPPRGDSPPPGERPPRRPPRRTGKLWSD